MTRRKFNNDINDATELGRKNAQKHRYLNWCKHLQIDLVYPSELGQMTGLPIGPHQIQCPYFHGSQGVSVELIAGGFIQEHCVDCKYHEEVDPDNLGRGLVKIARLRKNQPDPHVLLRQQLRNVAQVDDPAKILQQNVSSDRELNGLIILFEESKHKSQAADKVLAAARDLSPQLFVPEAVRVLTTYLSDKDIGVKVIDILRAVCTKNPAHFDIALEPAKLAYNEHNYSEELAYFFGDFIKTRASMAGVAELVPKFISQHSLSMERIGFRRPSEGAIYALRAIAPVEREALTNLLKRFLDVGDNPGRLAVCNIIEHLIDIAPEIGNEIFDPLLHSLRLEEDRYGSSADGKTLSAIAEILRSNVSQYLPRLEAYYSTASYEIKALIFRVYRKFLEDDDGIEIHGKVIERAIADLARGAENIELLEASADYLGTVGRKRPQLLVDEVESLVGIMSLANEHAAQKPGKIIRVDITEHHDPSWYQKWNSISGEINKALEYVGREYPDKVASTLRDVIQGLLPKGKQVDKLVASLARTLGTVCEGSLEATQASVPQLFGLLVSPHPFVQAAAVDAFENISSSHGNVLPDDVQELLKQLICADQASTILLNSLFDFYRHSDITDLASALPIFTALAAWEPSVSAVSTKQSCVNALQSVSAKFPPLRTVASKVLWKYCYHEDMYVRKDNIEAWHRWSREYPAEYPGAQLVLATIHYYRDFPQEIQDFNGIREPFETLLRIKREFFASHLKELIKVAKSQRPELAKNRRNFADLLTLNEHYAEAAELYEDFRSTLGKEPRFDGPKSYWALHVEINQAEAALITGRPGDAKSHLEKAVGHVEEQTKYIHDDEFRTAEQKAEEHQLIWQQVRLRSRWIHALQSFKLSSVGQTIVELSNIEKEYAILFEKYFDKIHEIDEPIIESIKQLLSSIRLVLEWVDATRKADATALRFLDAARSAMDVALESAGKGSYPLYLDQLSAKAKPIETIKRANDVPGFMAEIGSVPVPHLHEHGVRGRWGELRKFRERFMRSQGIQPSSNAPAPVVRETEPLVAEIATLLDGQKLDKEITLQAGVMYGIQFTLNMPHWPDQFTHVRLYAVTTSQLPGQLPQPEIDKPLMYMGSTTCHAHIMFQFPLSANAPAISIKLAANLIEPSGQKQKIILFGDTQFSLRIIERQPAPGQTVNITNSQGIVIGDRATVNFNTTKSEDKEKG